MKTAFYPRLAAGGIRKNMRLYLPYILTCAGMVTMHYIIGFLQYSDAVRHLPAAATVASVLDAGGWVTAFFACIFLFYTNSFLIRRRKKEFGLYNVLGMGRGSIGRILFWESLIISAVSLAGGLALGIALSKLAELGLVNMMRGEVTYTLSVNPMAILTTAAVFSVIFTLILLNALRQVRFSGAVSLMRSESAGEKPPKGNWVLGTAGLALLGGAYYIAVTIKNPLAAITLFFAAAAMVIAGTYLLMISGSVLLCRILQRCKGYYYKPNHFVSVSSMAYRMKRNGAGLASICVLATMVLVMISSTASLCFGAEDSLRSRYPREINITFSMRDESAFSEENTARLRGEILDTAAGQGVIPQNISDYRSATVSGMLSGGSVETDVSKAEAGLSSLSDVINIHFIPLADYNAMTGSNETLGEGEALLHTFRTEYSESTLSFNRGGTFRIKKHIDAFPPGDSDAMNIVASMTLIVPDLVQSVQSIDGEFDSESQPYRLRWTYDFDTGEGAAEQVQLFSEINERLKNPAEPGEYYFSAECREAERNEFYAVYGGLFYLGIILSVVFIFAAVLIIYYKQISEGYEDCPRFEIMRKIGMTGREIRGSINSQLLTVFFLPLAGAACHLVFAFPIIRKLLLLFNLNNISLFAAVTVISFVVFALFYTLVYRITSNAYYRIVSGAESRGR